MTRRHFVYLCLLAFVVTLALIIGWRLSDQAMAVIVGVVAGVAASIPTSLVVAWITLQGHSALRAQASPAAPPVQPQVIIVHPTPPAAPANAASPQSQRSLTVLPAYASPESTALNGLPFGPRQFTILGEDMTGHW